MDADHGTRKRYQDGCACAPCRTAWATYIRERRRGRGDQLPRSMSIVEREIARAEVIASEEAPEDPAVSIRLSPLAIQILAEIQRRTNARRGEIVDQLLRERGAEMTAA